MRKFVFITLLLTVLLPACVHISDKPLEIPRGTSRVSGGRESVANFAEGCFWHAEIVFQSLAGVRDAVSGYAGGQDTQPDYEKVCSGTTGHAETVQVYYDSTKISFRILVDAFFASVDPTQVDRQGNDVGTQYRSMIFYRNEAEKAVIDEAIRKLASSKKYKNPIVTEVVPFTTFYPAEDYHQEYIFNHPGNSYVKIVSIPDFIRFKEEFPGKFK